VVFRHPPQKLFDEPVPAHANYLRFRLGPDRVSTAMGVRTKAAGERMVGRESQLFVCQVQADEMLPYERLLGDAMRGDQALFARQDSVETAWAIVDGLLARSGPVEPYDPGSWGPPGASRMLEPHGGWYDPAPDDGTAPGSAPPAGAA
jgi:glucose-6-phosphate 1-dehydrogenase